MTTRWKVENGAREEKKRYSRPKKRRKRKYLRHLVHFFLFSRKKAKLIQIWIAIATFRYFLCCCCCFVLFCLWREKKGTNFEEMREKRKLLSFPQDNIVVKSQSRDSFGSNKQHQQHQMMMMMMRNRRTTTTTTTKKDNTFSSSRVSSVFLFLDHFRVWRTTTIPTTTTTTTTTETRITER